MYTEILKPDEIEKAARLIKNGSLVAMPTETVYGLGADALNGKAVADIFKAKGRPMDNPLIVHIAKIEDVYRLTSLFPPKAQILAEHFWPGPLTIVMPKADIIPDEVSAGLDTVAVRYPSHPVAEALILAAGTPIAAPSANLSGSPSPTLANHVYRDLNGKIPAIIDGGRCEVGLESTVITVADDIPRLLRPGGITLEEMENVIGEIQVDKGVLNQLEQGARVSSPGMKYKHYAPNAKIILIKGGRDKYTEYVNKNSGEGVGALCYDEDIQFINVKAVSLGKENDAVAQAHNLFGALRNLDNMQLTTVYARCPEPKGVGLAVYNRLIRAAGFEVKELA